MKPRLLDLFCCAGGASWGYHLAGFDVVGVDLCVGDNATVWKRYPFEFHRGDAVEFVKEHGHEFDAVHASPPCQRFTRGLAALKASDPEAFAERYVNLIPETRQALQALPAHVPWVIENGPGSPLVDPIVLCGTMFARRAVDTDGIVLHLQRDRLFESNVPLTAPEHRTHRRSVQWAGVYGGARRDKHEARHVRKGGYVPPDLEVLRTLIGGHPAMNEHDLFESIPPAYTQWVGLQLLSHVARVTRVGDVAASGLPRQPAVSAAAPTASAPVVEPRPSTPSEVQTGAVSRLAHLPTGDPCEPSGSVPSLSSLGSDVEAAEYRALRRDGDRDREPVVSADTQRLGVDLDDRVPLARLSDVGLADRQADHDGATAEGGQFGDHVADLDGAGEGDERVLGLRHVSHYAPVETRCQVHPCDQPDGDLCDDCYAEFRLLWGLEEEDE